MNIIKRKEKKIRKTGKGVNFKVEADVNDTKRLSFAYRN